MSYTKYSSDRNLGEGLCICTSFHFPDYGLYLSNAFYSIPGPVYFINNLNAASRKSLEIQVYSKRKI